MPRYLLKIEDRISGPFSENALVEMASVRAFTEEACLAPEGTVEWKNLRELPELQARCFPARKKIVLKEKPFEKIEGPGDEPISIDNILKENLIAEAALPQKRLKRLPNRRRRDFLLAVVLIDGALAGLWYFLPRGQESDVGLGSAAVFCTLGLYWVFYQIMGRY